MAVHKCCTFRLKRKNILSPTPDACCALLALRTIQLMTGEPRPPVQRAPVTWREWGLWPQSPLRIILVRIVNLTQGMPVPINSIYCSHTLKRWYTSNLAVNRISTAYKYIICIVSRVRQNETQPLTQIALPRITDISPLSYRTQNWNPITPPRGHILMYFSEQFSSVVFVQCAILYYIMTSNIKTV